jgi:hypothetical protein
VIAEAMPGGARSSDYQLSPSTMSSSTASGLAFKLPTGALDTAAPAGIYSIDLKLKTLSRGSLSWSYFDQAKAVRK